MVAFSSGNHAQGVALAARLVGTSAVICMPKDAPRLKLEATRNYGAEVVFYDRHVDDREAVARRIAEETKRVIVPPYDDYAIMAGQGTVALELFQDVPSLDALVTPSGAAASWPVARQWPAASSGYPGLRRRDGHGQRHVPVAPEGRARHHPAPPPTIADGIRLTTPGALTFPILKERLTDIVLVSDDEVREAVRFLVLRAHVVAEPTGAVGAAAVLAAGCRSRGARAWAWCSRAGTSIPRC